MVMRYVLKMAANGGYLEQLVNVVKFHRNGARLSQILQIDTDNRA